MKNVHTFLAIIIFAIISSATISCTKDASPGANEVFIQNTAFNPSTITVAKGTTITWTNKDSGQHTVTSDGSSFDSGTLNGGATFSKQFNTSGTFPYHCNIHSSMTATVVVTP